VIHLQAFEQGAAEGKTTEAVTRNDGWQAMNHLAVQCVICSSIDWSRIIQKDWPMVQATDHGAVEGTMDDAMDQVERWVVQEIEQGTVEGSHWTTFDFIQGC